MFLNDSLRRFPLDTRENIRRLSGFRIIVATDYSFEFRIPKTLSKFRGSNQFEIPNVISLQKLNQVNLGVDWNSLPIFNKILGKA